MSSYHHIFLQITPLLMGPTVHTECPKKSAPVHGSMKQQATEALTLGHPVEVKSQKCTVYSHL